MNAVNDCVMLYYILWHKLLQSLHKKSYIILFLQRGCDTFPLQYFITEYDLLDKQSASEFSRQDDTFLPGQCQC